MQAWNVMNGEGVHVDTVFHVATMSAEDVKNGLVDHDGFSPDISVTPEPPAQQVWEGADLRDQYEKELRAMDAEPLERHASVGRICRCRNCYCCLASDEKTRRALNRIRRMS